MRSPFSWILAAVAVGAAAAVPASAGAQTLPLQIEVSNPRPQVGETVELSIAGDVGPCPLYFWTTTAADGEQLAYGPTQRLTVRVAGDYTTELLVRDICDGTVRAGTAHVQAAPAPLTRAEAVRYVRWVIADRHDIPREDFNGPTQQFRVRAWCPTRVSALAFDCRFDGGCCLSTLRGRGRISLKATRGDRFWWRFRVTEGLLREVNGRYRERVVARRTWSGSTPR